MRQRLRTLGLLLILAAFLTGLLASWLWLSSARAWQMHLSDSFVTGFSLHETLRTGGSAPKDVIVAPLNFAETSLAQSGSFSQLSNVPTPGFVTQVSLLPGSGRDAQGEVLSLAIVSGSMRYAVSDIVSKEGQSIAQKLGNVTKLLATYCSEPILIARLGQGDWMRLDGTAIWGCGAAPRDFRLVAVLTAALALAILYSLVADTSSMFDRFARALRGRRRFGGPAAYAESGPEELREIITAVNTHLEAERDQLHRRAVVLSGVSHDLGTPATRLRLRTALIPDGELRDKLEADIDSMTDMIDSVLTYTRSELSVEEPRKISLTSLVEALVDDYRDMGRPVELQRLEPQMVEGGQSVFAARYGQGAVPYEHRMLVTGRPISLQRAVSNLIDNALKYGRRATVELEANSEHAIVTVEDEGSGFSAADIEQLFAPFKRGDNVGAINGFGLGLTIVATVAEQHGGSLQFETGAHGLRARLEICRN
ncbi:HAMP domain-containing sensor histidine kinase [Aliiroseovarius sp. KMU-50]|uniref:histidine kinase n=1 Tax=Aliiroseovarius salicola TaxID=3009082 RepID=A0ABT4W653_9RHOB|nr:HAMP domain-containing sensor histidine kinase [Aliiroseovarius sp. KMU-50]MDA5095327.1 HAMP domain-containing sensor histidine kinase [Aliiroseovarius sp. KMU-50]